MRLLDVRSFPPLPPEDELVTKPLKYAILSHTWRDGEVTLLDLRQPEQVKGKAGWEKLRGARQQAARDGYDKIWIDTCCIDKTSSAELGEAINSMYRYYKESTVCYVYLDDFKHTSDSGTEGGPFHEDDQQQLARCRWFTRGWTLQELIAPANVRFYDRDWTFFGTLDTLVGTIHDITRIHLTMLEHECSPTDFSIAQRMSWAASRETTRQEDQAYSLLGILDVNLDIRYGEGSRAFLRLQEEIIKGSSDQSIFAWDVRTPSKYWKDLDKYRTHLLAHAPDVFETSGDIVPYVSPIPSYHMTNTGLNVTGRLEWITEGFGSKPTWIQKVFCFPQEQVFLLNCYSDHDPGHQVSLRVEKDNCSEKDRFATSWHVRTADNFTVHGSRLASCSSPYSFSSTSSLRTITIGRSEPRSRNFDGTTILPSHRLRLRVMKQAAYGGATMHIEWTDAQIQDMESPPWTLPETFVDLKGVKSEGQYHYCTKIYLRRDKQIIMIRVTLYLGSELPLKRKISGVLSIALGTESSEINMSYTTGSKLLLNEPSLFHEAKDTQLPLPLTKIQWLNDWVAVSAKIERGTINGTDVYTLTVRPVLITTYLLDLLCQWLIGVCLKSYSAVIIPILGVLVQAILLVSELVGLVILRDLGATIMPPFLIFLARFVWYWSWYWWSYWWPYRWTLLKWLGIQPTFHTFVSLQRDLQY